MKKIINNGNRLSREKITNPFPNSSYQNRLEKSKAINYECNKEIIDLGNGYLQIQAKNPNQVIKL